MSERKYYCICDSNCKFETMTKEQILAAIAQAATTGLVYDANAAVVSKVKESNAGGSVTFWVGTQAQYNALESVEKNCMYIITDDTYKEDVERAIENALPKSGGTLTGELRLTRGVNWDYELPASAADGTLFFKVVR